MCAMQKLIVSLSVILCASAVVAQQVDPVGAGPGPASAMRRTPIPGSTPTKDSTSPARKEVRWFAFVNGPKRSSAGEQMRYARSLEAEGAGAGRPVRTMRSCASGRRRRRLLRRSFALPRFALRRTRTLTARSPSTATLRTSIHSAATTMRSLTRCTRSPWRMRAEGKTIVFFRFVNTVEVRRAYECCVLRAPGAKWAPAAMLTIGALREEEGKLEEAVKVYENLRSLHYGTDEAGAATLREASVRLGILDECDYNRARCLDTLRFWTWPPALRRARTRRRSLA